MFLLPLLGGLPQLVHPWLHLVSVWFGALGPADVGVGVEHLTVARPIGVGVGVDVTVGL